MPPKTRKQKRKKGGRYIASGSYGCGYRPAIRCRGEAYRIQGAISKVMERRHALEEFRSYSLLQPIDPQQTFFLYPFRMCELGQLELPENSLEPCRVAKKDRVLLQYMDGGANLHRLELERADVVVFFQDLIHLFQGLVILDRNEIVHGDIKLENVVAKKVPTGRFSFKYIDFGFTTKRDALERTFGEDRLQLSSFNWPFDLRFLVRGYIYTADEKRAYESRIRGFLANFPPIYSSGADWEREVYNEFRAGPAYNKLKSGIDIFGLGLLLSQLYRQHFNKIRLAHRGKEMQVDEIEARMVALVGAMMDPNYKRRIDALSAYGSYNQIVSLLNILVGQPADASYPPTPFQRAPLVSLAAIVAAEQRAIQEATLRRERALQAEREAAARALARQRERERQQARYEVERARDAELQAVTREIEAQKEAALDQEKQAQSKIWNTFSKQKTNQYVRQFESETFVNKPSRNARRNQYVAALKENLEQGVQPFRQRQAYIEAQYNQFLQARQAEINQRWDQELQRRLAPLA